MQTASTSSPDPILDTQVFLGRYKIPILIALAVALVAAAVYGGYRVYAANREAKASALLAGAKTIPDYQKVIADYPDAGAAVSAYLLLAKEQREKQQFAEANATLEKFVKAQPKDGLVPTAKMAMAANLDSMGKGDAALEMYRQIASNYAQDYTAPLALLAQAQILKANGKTEEARQACETVMTQYRQSYAAMEATQMLMSLKPAPTATATEAPATAPVSAVPLAPAPAVSVAPKASAPKASVSVAPVASPAVSASVPATSPTPAK
ncbi:MAG: tetratricopeptide repeat protein [Chthoniobacterales bacterium]